MAMHVRTSQSRVDPYHHPWLNSGPRSHDLDASGGFLWR